MGFLDDAEIIGGYKISPLKNSKQEKKRLEHKPKVIRFLLVAESMPEGGSFFYFENSTLYEYTKEAFLNNFNWSSIDFLKFFKSNGFYLDDLCLEPVNHLLNDKRILARKAYEESMAQRIKDYNPLVVVTLLKSIEKNVNRAIEASGKNVSNFAVTSPFFGGQYKYVAELGKLLKDVIKPMFKG